MKKLFYSFMLLAAFGTTKAQTYLVDNFNYSGNDSLNSNGWVIAANGTTNAIRANVSGLTYTGYTGSGIGPAAALTTSGQDLCKDGSASMSSGSVYASFLMNVSAAQTGDYFFAFLPAGSVTNYFARTYIKAQSTGYYKIGVTKASNASAETTVYSIDSFSYSTTYLVVVKYQFNTGNNTDDSIKAFVFSSGIPATEPAIGKAETIGGTNTDAASLGRVALRQGAVAQTPTLVVDGIRFGASWADVALPVTYNSFTATNSNNTVVLNWSTASEINNSHFEVQKSTDNRNFETIGKVKGNGNSNSVLKYAFVDASPSKGTSYYRLKQVDFDGKSEYSRVMSIVNNEIKRSVGHTLPNPFNTELNVHINTVAATTAQVEVVDMLGKVHYSGMESLQPGENTVHINTAQFNDGIYFVRMNINGEVSTQKIIKK